MYTRYLTVDSLIHRVFVAHQHYVVYICVNRFYNFNTFSFSTTAHLVALQISSNFRITHKIKKKKNGMMKIDKSILFVILVVKYKIRNVLKMGQNCTISKHFDSHLCYL